MKLVKTKQSYKPSRSKNYPVKDNHNLYSNMHFKCGKLTNKSYGIYS